MEVAKNLSKARPLELLQVPKPLFCGSAAISVKTRSPSQLPGGPMTPGRLAMTGKDTEKPKSKFAWNQATWAAGMGPVDQNIGRKEKQHEN